MQRLGMAAALLTLLLVPGVHAQSVAAVSAAEQALTAANDRTPLTMAVATLVDVKANVYGAYQIRASNHYKAGDAVVFYVEPVGLKHKEAGGTITCGFTVDLLLKRDGTIIFGKEEFISADFPSRHALQEIMVNGDLTVKAPSAAYEIELVMHDHNSNETTKATLPFVID